jgi:hypothetical protein
LAASDVLDAPSAAALDASVNCRLINQDIHQYSRYQRSGNGLLGSGVVAFCGHSKNQVPRRHYRSIALWALTRPAAAPNSLFNILANEVVLLEFVVYQYFIERKDKSK